MNDLDPNNSPDSQRRLMVALALAMALTFVYTFFFGPQQAPPGAEVADAGVAAAEPVAPVAPPVAPLPPEAEAAAPVAEEELPALTFQRERNQVVYTFSTDGAGLTSAVLQGPKMREQPQLSVMEGYKLLFGGEVPPAPQMDVAQPVPQLPLPLGVSIEGPNPLPASTRYAVQEEGAEGGVVFTASRGPWQVTKSLQWPREGFELAYTLQVKNTS
ncbi:MAG TPA: hypothetical protein VLQ93_21700, partial [Myxococcaceae bacterium]|nr:hypothetical protein [Myxococcaceae bacterium]